jgi:hypothetical protein
MKYRNLKHLIDYGSGTTETDTSLDDYYQLGYLRKKGKYPERNVKNVILIYPSKDENCFERNMAIYIGINPELEFEDSNAYKLMREIIEDNC